MKSKRKGITKDISDEVERGNKSRDITHFADSI